MNLTAQEKLNNKINNGLHICVGLDSDINKIPEHFKKYANPIYEFNKEIIKATVGNVAAYKINFAFYESWGIDGLKTLENTIKMIPEDTLVIADSKRGDIGNTSLKYAQSVYDYYKCDSITLHPYMGYDSIEPFLKYEDKINFVLGLTSNKSAFDFEKQKLSNGKYLYQQVIEKVNEWNKYKNLGIVFGATNNKELENNILSFNDMPVLLPGVGAQGGSLKSVVHTFKINNKNNFIINVSRGIIYCDSSKAFSNKVFSTLNEYNKQIKDSLR